MPNPYFKFKQFIIYQDKCSMKVCTDACLFGAWVAGEFERWLPESTIHEHLLAGIHEKKSNKVLDIGSGAGLLSLMLAQKLSGTIDAIEIEEDAFAQAKDNIERSTWKNRITIVHADVNKFTFTSKYNLIISNPPFYENDLRAADPGKNRARHDETLTLKALLDSVNRNLTSDGLFAVLLPYHRLTYCITVAITFQLFPHSLVSVKPTDKHNYFRIMIVFKKYYTGNVDKKEIIIKEGINYSGAFIALLKDYYLYL